MLAVAMATLVISVYVRPTYLNNGPCIIFRQTAMTFKVTLGKRLNEKDRHAVQQVNYC